MRRALAIILTMITTASYGQAFWQGTAYGDSVDRVRSKVKGLSEPQTSEDLSIHGIEVMMVSTTVIAGRDFDAHFQFSKSGLDRVILIARSEVASIF